MACNELSQCCASSVPQAFLRNLQASCPRSSGETLSNFWSGAFAGLALEAGTHGARVLHTRHQQLRRGHPLGSLGIKWWVAAVRSPSRPKGPYQGALGTLAAGGIWSGIFGSAYVPVRAAVDATAPADQPMWGPAAAAAAGSLASSSVRVPLQVVKERMERYEFFCSLQAFERILTREGLASLYSGWTRSVARNLPFDAMLFVLYDTGKSKLLASREPPPQEQQQQHQLDLGSGGGGGGSGGASAPAAALVPPLPQSYRLWEAAVIGGGAGAVTALITSPLELVAAPFLGASRRATRQASPPLQASAAAAAATAPKSANRPGPAPQSVAPAPQSVEGSGGDLGSPSGRHGAAGTCGGGGGGSGDMPQGTAGGSVDVRNGRAGSSSSSSSSGASLGSTTAASEGICKISYSSNSSSSRSGGGGGGSSSHALASLRRVGAACSAHALATAQTLTINLKTLATTSTTAVASAGATPGTAAAAGMVIATAPAPVTAVTAVRASSSFLAASQLTVAAARRAPPPPPPRRSSPLGSAPGGGGGGGGGPPRGLSLFGTLALRVAWAAFEGAVFFPSLEAAIPLCDWLFLPSAQMTEPAPAGEGDVGLRAEVLDGSQVGSSGALLRHPAHPLHW